MFELNTRGSHCATDQEPLKLCFSSLSHKTRRVISFIFLPLGLCWVILTNSHQCDILDFWKSIELSLWHLNVMCTELINLLKEYKLCVFVCIYSLQKLFGEVPRREQHVSHMSDCHSPEPSTAVHRVRVYHSRQTRLNQCKPQSCPVGVHQGTPVNSVDFDCWLLCMLVACRAATWVFEGDVTPSSSLCRRVNYWCPGWSVPLQHTHPRENICWCDLKVLHTSGTESLCMMSF